VFTSGQTAHLIVPLGSDQIFISIRNKAGRNDLSIITYNKGGSINIDTNGGIGKINFVEKLYGVLLKGPFSPVDKGKLERSLAEKPSRNCDLRFNLSPE
jgi:hypothetical protein